MPVTNHALDMIVNLQQGIVHFHLKSKQKTTTTTTITTITTNKQTNKQTIPSIQGEEQQAKVRKKNPDENNYNQ
jgi:hypothetical protein